MIKLRGTHLLARLAMNSSPGTKHLLAHFLLSVLLLSFILTSCRVGPVYRPPESPHTEAWKHSPPVETAAPDLKEWWHIFSDEKLNELEDSAIANNKNLATAMDRVAQARAQMGIVRADLFPQLNVQPLYNNQGVLVPNTSGIPSAPPFIRVHEQLYSLPLNLSYEVDLWGKLRDQYDAARFNYQAQQDAYNAALLILTADVASRFYQIRTLDTLIQLYRQTIETRQKAYDINLARYQYKMSDKLSVAEAGLNLSNVHSLYQDAIREREIQVNALAVLLGLPPPGFCLEKMPLTDPPPGVPAGIPSDVLIRRPDIASAERIRAAQHALVGAAYASFFPSLTLTGGLGFESSDFKLFLRWISRFWQMGAAMNQMVFDGGRKSSVLELAWARFQEADDAYKQLVLTSFQEVEDALVNLEGFKKESESVQQAVDYAQNAYTISKDRFLNGVAFYLQVVDNERQLLDNQRALALLLESRYIATIQLIKALGGGWDVERCN